MITLKMWSHLDSIHPYLDSLWKDTAESCEEEEAVEEEDVVENVTQTLPEPENNLPEYSPEREETLTEIQLNGDPPEESSPLPAIPVEPSVNDDIVDNDLTFRRLTRQRALPERLQYSTLGNPRTLKGGGCNPG